MRSFVVCLVALLALCGCATTSQSETRLLHEQVNTLTAQLQRAECRMDNLERQTDNLKVRDKQLATVVIDMLFNRLRATKLSADTTQPTDDKTLLKACLLACERIRRMSGPGDDRWVIINCADVAECNDPPSEQSLPSALDTRK